MRFSRSHLSILCLSALLTQCRTTHKPSEAGEEAKKVVALRQTLREMNMTGDCPDQKVCATILQLNDVYEIDAVSGGSAGGLDRVAAVRKALAENPKAGPVLTVLAGDFLNPSGLGVIKENGKAWAGRPMISLLKAIGTDFLIFGNHEFDLSSSDLQARLDESVLQDETLESCQLQGSTAKLDKGACQKTVFEGGQASPSCLQWIASNVSTSSGKAFQTAGMDIPKARVITLKQGNAQYQLGLLGLTIEKNQRDFVQYTEHKSSATALLKSLKNAEFGSKPDGIVAITHLNRADDVTFLQDFPDVLLSLGGHDHKNSIDCVASPKRCVSKADANTRTVYLHRLIADPQEDGRERKTTISSQLFHIDTSTPRDESTRSLIDCWFLKAEGLFNFHAGKVKGLRDEVGVVPDIAFDARDDAVRNHKGSNFTQFFAQSMFDYTQQQLSAGQQLNLAFFNAGSIRIDDLVGPGRVSFYEMIRILPFGGNLQTAQIKISDLARILKRSWHDLEVGEGAILHLYPRIASHDQDSSLISEENIQKELMTAAKVSSPDAKVLVVSSDYLLKFGQDLTASEQELFDGNVEQPNEKELQEALLSGFQKLGSGARKSTAREVSR